MMDDKLDQTLTEIHTQLNNAIIQLDNLIYELTDSDYKMLRDKLIKKLGKLQRLADFIKDLST